MAGLSDLEEAIESQEEQKQLQQHKIDAQEQLAMELGNAQKEQALALAQERRARVVADISLSSERASEAEENRAQAALARAKTITEIAQLEDDRIIKVLNFVNQLEQQETQDRIAIDENIHQLADEINTETQGSAENMREQVLNDQAAQEQARLSQIVRNNQNQGGQSMPAELL